MLHTESSIKLFKPGQKVRFIGNYPSGYLRRGDVYTVVSSTGHSMLLTEVFGPIFQPQYFESIDVPSSMAEFRCAAKQGGLQEHSLGNAYPLSIVGYGRDSAVVYRIENLTKDTVFGSISTPFEYNDAATAVWWLDLLLTQKLTNYKWHPRNPKPELAGY